MNASTKVSGEDGSPVLVRELGWHALAPVAALLLAQVALYIWLAPRGFDFTDEAYYFLSYLHWRDIAATVTFFAVYLDLPFRLVGESVAAIRIFSLLLLLASSAFFTREALQFSGRRGETAESAPWSLVLVGMSGSLLFFGDLITIRAPAYNLLALCAMLVATGLLFRLVEREETTRQARAAMLCYGLAIGVCGLGGKPTSAAIMVACHILFFALANRDWRGRHLFALVTLSLAGVGLNFALLQWAHPQWYTVLREGLVMMNMTYPRDPLAIANTLRWQLQTLSWFVLPGTAAAMGLLLLFMRLVGPGHRRGAASILVAALVFACLPRLIGKDLKELWLPLLAATTMLLWTIEASSRQKQRLVAGDAVDLASMALLFALPLAFSFGTTVPILEHSRMTAVFPIVAILIRLLHLYRLGLLARPALVAALATLCVPPLVFQVRAMLDVEYTYRQVAALGEQTVPVQLGATQRTLLLDPTTRDSLDAVSAAARAAGFLPGQSILDLSGDGPGWVYALGGKPVGVAWLLGGYAGSEATAAYLLEQTSLQELRQSWILSSDDNYLTIKGWQGLLHERLGAGTHERVLTLQVATRHNSRRIDKPTYHLQLWKPSATTAAGGG